VGGSAFDFDRVLALRYNKAINQKIARVAKGESFWIRF
jgi:hypothetical protein